MNNQTAGFVTVRLWKPYFATHASAKNIARALNKRFLTVVRGHFFSVEVARARDDIVKTQAICDGPGR